MLLPRLYRVLVVPGGNLFRGFRGHYRTFNRVKGQAISLSCGLIGYKGNVRYLHYRVSSFKDGGHGSPTHFTDPNYLGVNVWYRGIYLKEGLFSIIYRHVSLLCKFHLLRDNVHLLFRSHVRLIYLITKLHASPLRLSNALLSLSKVFLSVLYGPLSVIKAFSRGSGIFRGIHHVYANLFRPNYRFLHDHQVLLHVDTILFRGLIWVSNVYFRGLLHLLRIFRRHPRLLSRVISLYYRVPSFVLLLPRLYSDLYQTRVRYDNLLGREDRLAS